MRRDWIVGPTEVRDGDAVDIVVTGTNTDDDQLPTADQQKMDRLTIDAFNVYYSWLLGNFASGRGLTVVAEYFGAAGGVLGAFLADPVGTLLGYEPQGPCNGMVFAGSVSLTSRDLEVLGVGPGSDPMGKRPDGSRDRHALVRRPRIPQLGDLRADSPDGGRCHILRQPGRCRSTTGRIESRRSGRRTPTRTA